MALPICFGNRGPLSDEELRTLSGRICATYSDNCGINNIEGGNLPRRQEILAIIGKLLEIVFPGYDGESYSRADVAPKIEQLTREIERDLFDQIWRAFRHSCGGADCDRCQVTEKTSHAVRTLLCSLPEIRESMKLDVAAAYIGDPAATSYDEIILSYPSIKAITIQRLAHILYLEQAPLIPRMMTEYAHSLTGIDIHPGASLGKGVFIDHGTGVVVGETAEIGDNVRIYQGVTLGALSFPKDASGALVKGRKRHPTIENDVIIYAGAIVLGDIVIGAGSVIGGSTWVTESLAPGTKIIARPPEQLVKLAEK